MKVKELMQRDKVYETLIEDTPQVVTVEEIGQNHIYIGFKEDDMALLRYEPEHLGFPIKHIEPIPITEEILKLNGFIHKETMEEWWHEEYDPVWGMRMSDFELTDEFKFGRAKLTYVHELQHALRLCGLNDLADNFKVTE